MDNGKENGNEPATGFCNELGGSFSAGLSKRELIAAMCLQGMLSGGANVGLEVITGRSIEFADALLSQLGNKKN